MKGLIFIPDITGFTNFVNHVDEEVGATVTRKLLNEIISSNPLDVELSEIEGDAILYYKAGEPITTENLFEGFTKISNAFNAKYNCLKDQYNLADELSIKFIVHYGTIKVYDIKGFKSLYGEALIESHRLLKNGDGFSNYILITEDYFNALKQNNDDFTKNGLSFSDCYSKFFTGLRSIRYYFFSYLPCL